VEKQKKLPNGVEIRSGSTKDSIRVTFNMGGTRYRETLKISVTDENIRWAGNLVGEIQNRIERGTFVYAEYFPHSRAIKTAPQSIIKAQETPERQRARMAAKQRFDVVGKDRLQFVEEMQSKSKEAIMAMSRFKPTDHVGIYFLIANDDIVYVGQSVNVHSRVAKHFALGLHVFDSYTYVLCSRRDLDALEAVYIQKFKPTLNCSYPYKTVFRKFLDGAGAGQVATNNDALNRSTQNSENCQDARQSTNTRRLKAV
jgi:hypothetical protein